MARQAGGGRTLSGYSVSVLETEIMRRQRKLDKLQRKYQRLMSAAGKIERQILAQGGDPGGGSVRRGRVGAIPGRRRARNDMNLVEALAKVLTGKTMGVTEVAEAVQRAGYKTTSDNFRTIVNQALIKSNLFKKVSRGQYTAK